MTCIERRKNFSQEEKLTFLQLVKDEKILYSAQIGTGSNCTVRLKQAAWDRVTKKFNSMYSDSKRSVKQLKKLWGNWKTEQRMKMSRIRKDGETRNDSLENNQEGGRELEELFSYAHAEPKNADCNTIVLSKEMVQKLSALKSDVMKLMKVSEGQWSRSSTKYDTFPESSSNVSPKHSTSDGVDIKSIIEGCSSPANETSMIVEDIEETEEDIYITDDQESTEPEKNCKPPFENQDSCNFQKKLLQEEHNLKMKILREKLEAAQAKKEYYRIKINNLNARFILPLFNGLASSKGI